MHRNVMIGSSHSKMWVRGSSPSYSAACAIGCAIGCVILRDTFFRRIAGDTEPANPPTDLQTLGSSLHVDEQASVRNLLASSCALHVSCSSCHTNEYCRRDR